jgi:trehalose 6-phosphate phosphatase
MGIVQLAEVVDSLRALLPDVLVATDFDGTLAPLVPDPQQSRPADGAVAALSALARRGAQVAVITGRDAETVVRLGGLRDVPGVIVAGIYGIETWHDGAIESPDTPPQLHELQQRLPTVLDGADPAVWIEDKRLSLVVHGRRAADPDAALAPLREPVAALADELGLEMHPGRDVLELRLPGYDKAGAIDRLAGDRAGVLYLGDDLGDIPAFEHLRQLRGQGRAAFGVAVRSSGVADAADAADVSVAGPADAVDLLRSLAS